MATKTYLLIHLTAIIYKIDYMASIQYSIIADCSSKDLLQSHAANDPCDWEPPLSCRSKRIKLDVPESNWHCQMAASSKGISILKLTTQKKRHAMEICKQKL